MSEESLMYQLWSVLRLFSLTWWILWRFFHVAIEVFCPFPCKSLLKLCVFHVEMKLPDFVGPEATMTLFTLSCYVALADVLAIQSQKTTCKSKKHSRTIEICILAKCWKGVNASVSQRDTLVIVTPPIMWCDSVSKQSSSVLVMTAA